ncbi:MAG: aspartate--tRNA ligase [Defluviitaleaceae bacterium]|nr:aspartate--tRNA ligase [Defluviitaleaceae bacterium]
MENLGQYRRTHYCGEVTEQFANQTVTVMGWVNRVRKLGQLIFVTLRDHTGLVQIAFDENTAADLFEKATGLKSEYVVAIEGNVALRREKDINADMATGKIEIMAGRLVVLSVSDVPPFQIGDENVSDSLRLKYRYLDLRRAALQQNLRIRHAAALSARNFLSGQGFAEVETPILTNSSPEGARDYLVPSRVNPGRFYALPQSPQILKQILMVGGFDKYFQIAKCLRDEDLRADRQPEFTQIDIEQSFVDQEDVLAMTEGLVARMFADAAGVDLPTPFPRMTHKEAMTRFGSDKPDLRFGMELVDISAVVAGSEFAVFQGALDAGGSVRGINAKGCGKLGRKQIDNLIEYVKTYRAKGLAWIQISDTGEIKTTISKFFDEAKLAEIIAALDGQNGDLLLICADKDEIVFDALGNLRCEIARRENLIPQGVYKPLWVVEFPLLIWDEDDDRYYANHHPFTAPMDEDFDLLETAPAKARSKQHDLVMNGYEAGGGSIRIHRQDMQQKMFEVLGYSQEQAYEKFAHLMDALKFGAPPHGGIALGLDRLAMLLCGTGDIRDVIAFPKQQNGSCPMTGAPNSVFAEQLEELKISIKAE